MTACSLLGCTDNLRDATSVSIAQTVKKSVSTDGKQFQWLAPELQVSHYRTLFYGYDSIYYRLVAQKPSAADAGYQYQVSIDAHYGGSLRHYDAIRFADGSSRKLGFHSHDTERCQFFNNLVYACLFRDRASLELSRSELEAARLTGLKPTLYSDQQDYETIDLPANYIQGFLQAVE